jgi:tetratricopeptide (TPR) repeat protein
MSPVNFSYRTNAYGSASVFVGNIDRVYGMQWTVELRLRPGETLLEERVTLANPSDVRHRYYWWNNAAVRVWDDSHIEYPMRFTASHGFTEVEPWPVVEDGKDLSVIGNQTDGNVSLFVHASREPFMGIWNPHTDSGTVHYAEFAELPGKKIWSWGADAEGLAWRKALSDDDSAYVEVQAGLYRNQETYAFLEPGQALHFSEFWMPVRGTGGITRANKNGVLFLERKDGQVRAALNVNRAFAGATIEIAAGETMLWSGVEDLSPGTTWSKTVADADAAPVTFRLHDARGEVLLEHTEGTFDWAPKDTVKMGPQPGWTAPAEDRRTVDDWMRVGRATELVGGTLTALAEYRAGVARYPSAMELKLTEARVLVGLLRFDEARPLLEECAAADTANAEIAYLLGLAREGTGDERGAMNAYETAYRQAEFRAPAGLRLGELHARRKDERAAEFFDAAATASPSDERIAEERAVVEGTSGAALDALLERFPLSAVLHEQAGRPDIEGLAADPYAVLRAAALYMRLGRYDLALAVLIRKYPKVPGQQAEPGAVTPQENPLTLYAAAYCLAQMHRDAAETLRRAAAAPMQWVFASTEEEEAALGFALEQNDSDAQAHALLGDLLFSKGMNAKGMREWERARQLAPRMALVGVELGQAQLELEHDVAGALKTFEAALGSDAKNPEVYVGMDEAMSLEGASAADRGRELARYPERETMPAPLLYQLALTWAEDGRFDEAEGLLQNRFFPSEESGVSSGQVLYEIRLMRAEADARAGRCAETGDLQGAGTPDAAPNGAAARDLWRRAEVASACHREAEAQLLWKQAAAAAGAADVVWARESAKHLPGYDEALWQTRLGQALETARRVRETTAYAGWWQYNLAAIEEAMGDKSAGEADLREVFLLPDSLMSHHMARSPNHF